MSIRDAIAQILAGQFTVVAEDYDLADAVLALLGLPEGVSTQDIQRWIAAGKRAEAIAERASPAGDELWSAGYRHCLNNILRPPLTTIRRQP